MADTNEVKSASNVPQAKRRWISRIRPWIQTTFLGLWLSPAGLRWHWFPGCVFHCYGCPLSSFACPIGVMANFATLHVFPLLVLGVLVLVGSTVGSLVCGWACPFGFLQDLLNKIPTRKYHIPSWMGYFRYVVLVGLVIVLPYWLGGHGIDFDKQTVSICRLCPAGGIEAGLPRMVQQSVHAGTLVYTMGWPNTVVLAGFLFLLLITYRPWCTIFCPLGAIFTLFNRFSLFFIRYHDQDCRTCNLCRSYCSYGVKVDQSVNNSRCIRCLECTTCGALSPALAPWSKPKPGRKPTSPASPASSEPGNPLAK